MKQITVIHAGPDYDLRISEAPIPEPGPSEVLIRVAAAGINRADLLQARGLYPPPAGASQTLGLEVSGTIAAVGPGAKGRVGDAVCALLTGGGYGEYALASHFCVLPVPAGMDVITAAALPEAFFTVWTNLFDTAALREGESLLVHGGASGIGTAAIQLAVAMGHRVFTTAGNEENCMACRELGAIAINYRHEDYVSVVLRETGGLGADVILDMIGGEYIGRNFTAAARGGRIVNIAFQKGPVAEVDFSVMLARSLTLAATTLRGRPPAAKGVIRESLRAMVWPLIEMGKIRPVVAAQFALDQALAAHRALIAPHLGKVLLTL